MHKINIIHLRGVFIRCMVTKFYMEMSNIKEEIENGDHLMNNT